MGLKSSRLIYRVSASFEKKLRHLTWSSLIFRGTNNELEDPGLNSLQLRFPPPLKVFVGRFVDMLLNAFDSINFTTILAVIFFCVNEFCSYFRPILDFSLDVSPLIILVLCIVVPFIFQVYPCR